MAFKIGPLLLLFTVLFSFQTAHSQLISNFDSCTALNDYYIGVVEPLVGPNGLTSSNAYTNTRSPPRKNGKFYPKRPGGPAGLPFRRILRDPKRVKFNNITEGIDHVAEDEDADGPVAGTDFSTTNVQVRGVDEPDIIKTDGKRVFTITGTTFSHVRVLDDGASGRRVGRLELPTYPEEMLIQGDYILVIGTVYEYKRPVYVRYKTDPSSGESATVVYQINVSRPKPRLVSTLYLEGRYVKSREVDGVARLVLSFNPLDSIWLYYPGRGAKRKQTQKWNREIIRYSRAGNWLPTYRLEQNGGIQTGVYATCGEVYYSPKVFSGFNLLTVVTLPVGGKLTPGSSATVMSDAETIYATKSAMYVTTSEFRFGDLSDDNVRWGANYRTSIHKFGLSDEGASYIASGAVTGSVINQFAMHEYQGTFYIATTDGASWWGNRDLTESKVTAFEPNERTKRLKKVGEVGNLGRGEQIFSVRYIRDTAYIVTFREVDPLYVLDLSNPKKMKVLGELKIPGFSSYLHPVAPGRILGVGQDATNTGSLLGAKVSLFDVSDKKNPKELSVWSLTGSYSDAEWDHRAFLYWKQQGVAVMPISVYTGSRYFTGAVVLEISDTKIRERGRVTHKIERSYTPNIKRNAIIGRTNLWSMSDEILQVNDINKVKKVKAQVKITS